MTTCIGEGDSPNAALFYCTGPKVGEIVDLKVNTSASEVSSFDSTSSGLKSTFRLGKSLSMKRRVHVTIFLIDLHAHAKLKSCVCRAHIMCHESSPPRCGGQIPCALSLMRTLALLPSTTLSQDVRPSHRM